jgi:hypothetical protein
MWCLTRKIRQFETFAVATRFTGAPNQPTQCSERYKQQRNLDVINRSIP